MSVYVYDYIIGVWCTYLCILARIRFFALNIVIIAIVFLVTCRGSRCTISFTDQRHVDLIRQIVRCWVFIRSNYQQLPSYWQFLKFVLSKNTTVVNKIPCISIRRVVGLRSCHTFLHFYQQQYVKHSVARFLLLLLVYSQRAQKSHVVQIFAPNDNWQWYMWMCSLSACT